jgi:5,10-methylenetetrahydromethanopterin reductase
MKISLGVYPNQTPAEIIATGVLADELGFATLWMLDSHLLFREVYTLLGALAVSTKRIRLGTAVTNPLTRNPTVTASAFATLAALSGNRATLGISVGDSALKAMNLEIAKLADLARAVHQCRALLAGEEVSFGPGNIARLHHPAVAVPIYVAATGPRMLKLSGEIADGVILMNGVAPPLIQAAIEIVRQGECATDEGKKGATRIAVWAACHPDRNAVKFNVARAILRKMPGPIDDLTRKVAEDVSRAYTYQRHGDAEAEFARLVPDELVPRFAFSGSAEAIAAQIAVLVRMGVDELILAIPSAPGISSRNEVMRQLAPALLASPATGAR